MKKVRWGIVSTGTIANTFAADMVYASNAEIVAVSARSAVDAAGFAGEYGIPRSCEGYDVLFADDGVDAIYVGTPHNLHLPHSIAALEAGKSVLCEKPLTTTASECRELLEVAAQTGGYLTEAMWTWFLPAIRQAKAWFDAGDIGELRHIRAELGFPKAYDPASRLFDPALAGGCLLDMGVYPIAIARLFTGVAPVDVQATSHYAPNGVDDDVVMTLDYGDCVAVLASSFRCKLPNTAYIIGSAGYIEIPHFWSARECHRVVLHEVVDSYYDKRRGSGLEFQIEAVSDDILRGRGESAIVTHAASLGIQQDMDRVRAAFTS